MAKALMVAAVLGFAAGSAMADPPKPGKVVPKIDPPGQPEEPPVVPPKPEVRPSRRSHRKNPR